jgi:hypothetical protein
VTMALNAVKPMMRLARQNVALRSTILSQADGTGARGLLDGTALKSGVEHGRYYALVNALRDIERIPTDEKSDMLLFIPQSYKLYWNMWDADDRCTYVGLVAPAISELAHIDGMPAVGCHITDQYNMPAYAKRVAEQGDVTDAALCEKVKAKGFRRVMILAPDEKKIPRRRVLECVS